MKQCPRCNALNPDDARYCHMCGYAFKCKRNALIVALMCIMVIAIIVGGVVLLINDQLGNKHGKVVELNAANPEKSVRNTIQTLCDAKINNDYGKFATVFAVNVKRFHGIYNVTRDEVVERYRNYDDKFGVFGKCTSVRWNTLQIWKNSAGGYSVEYVEDYHIDRYDASKYTDFVLEKHLELDEDYKIVSIYDNQLSRM